MALMAYMTAKGAKQGAIDGSITQKGREKTMGVIAVQYLVDAPRDPHTGLATGKRVHHPFTITKELDKATPKLYMAICNNEALTEVIIKFYAPSIKPESKGTEINHYTVTLTNAQITKIDFVQLNSRNPDLMKYVEYEEIGMTFQKIQWEWTDGGITGMDDWLAPQ